MKGAAEPPREVSSAALLRGTCRGAVVAIDSKHPQRKRSHPKLHTLAPGLLSSASSFECPRAASLELLRRDNTHKKVSEPPMPTSRAVAVLGMHRSGTSVLTRGLQGLGIFLGDDFLNAQPDNPTGYWENKGIVDLNERLLAVLGLNWESISLIDDLQWQRPEVQALSAEATAYLESHFLHHPLWGFKDPRIIRLLPFWRKVLQQLGADDQYVIAIRTPLGVATSLLRRQNIAPATSHLMSLVYLVPYLQEIAAKPFVVTDYDLLVAEPRAQLARIARALKIPLRESNIAAIEHFSSHFLDPNLRHGYFSRHDFDAIPDISPLIREAYLWLYQLATDQLAPDAPEFWAGWKRLRHAVGALIPSSAARGEQNSGGRLNPSNSNPQETEQGAAPVKSAETSSAAVPGDNSIRGV